MPGAEPLGRPWSLLKRFERLGSLNTLLAGRCLRFRRGLPGPWRTANYDWRPMPAIP